MKQLTLGLMFHFNQNTVPMAYVADRVCYRRLLEVFLAHPRCGFNLHFSGTLLTALAWDGSETLELLKTGIERGQFEILGSSYAQNILLATDEWDNLQQIEQHRRQLKDMLGVVPVGFWNPERCWDQRLAKLLLDAGYEYSFLETDVFREADDRRHQAVVRATEDDGRRLVLFSDDTNNLTVFGKAIRTGSANEFIEYLYNIWLAQSHDETLDFTSIYAQDAEATGLWQFEGGGQELDDVYNKLDGLLTKLEALPWLKVGTLTEKARSSKPVVFPELPAGQANWMLDVLRSKNMPWQETGYDDWFDYNIRAPKNIQTRELYCQVSRELRKHEAVLARYNNPKDSRYTASKRLYDLAVRTHVAHQYEFGCIGIDVAGEAQWQLVRSALVVLWASRLALEGGCGICKEDINADGLQEVTVVVGDNAYVFAPKGGRLLYWFNLKHGWQIVGNQNVAYYLERYRDDHSFTPDVHAGKEILSNLAGKPELGDLQNSRFVVRRRCLNDRVVFDGSNYPLGLEELPFTVSHCQTDEGLTLSFDYSGRSLAVSKTVVFVENGLSVRYLWSDYPGETDIAFSVENELTPDYLSLMDSGQEVLEVSRVKNGITIGNKATDCTVQATLTPTGNGKLTVTDEAGFLAWLCACDLAFGLDGQERKPIGWKLSLRLA